MDISINTSEYVQLKEHFNKILNIDKSLIKTRNDICTPIECVEEMTSKVPLDFWKKNIKILDPCCGNGNFHFVILYYLNRYHMKKKILEEMLFFNDTNTDRLDQVRKIFCATKYALNITDNDYFEYTSPQKFDLIVANPPYAKIKNGKRTAKNHNMIKSFVYKSLELLKPGGYLLFITPDNWMSCADRNTLIKVLTTKQILYLNIHLAKRYFKKIGSSFTWYLIENKDSYKDISIEGKWKKKEYTSTVTSEVRRFIPLFYNAIVQRILHKTVDNTELKKFGVETSSNLHKYTKKDLISKQQDDTYKYKLIHTPKQTVYASRAHKFQEGWKVFISTTDKYKTFVDNCGMTQSIAFIQCKTKEEADNISKVLTHPLYHFINNICRWGNFNNIRILQSLPFCDDYNEVYKKFGITKSEVKMIKSNI